MATKKPFDMDLSQIADGLAGFDSRFEFALDAYCERAAQGLESYAKKHRKWTDRTSDARKRLSGKTFRVKTGRRIELSHGVKYGIWLELANEKRFAIIEPSIKEYGYNKILPGFEKFIENKV